MRNKILIGNLIRNWKFRHQDNKQYKQTNKDVYLPCVITGALDGA